MQLGAQGSRLRAFHSSLCLSLQAWCLHPLGANVTLGGYMGRKLYVGNLPYSATEASIREAFSASGTVDSVNVITDRDTGQSKGFAFVEMASDGEAQKATQAMNGATLDGRQIKVSEAKPKGSG